MIDDPHARARIWAWRIGVVVNGVLTILLSLYVVWLAVEAAS